ncbi:rhodanese-related sulfurtransferase [Psychroserpens sp.]|uniref:oxygen-dependent tRNA uridine(34) hydroxylase TrhO n=1 Tax=Psychroserpens sp. TaxID=2020870 RepID=UPI001B1AEDBC|nr:rhodanese-related sulfurtransferase [Psychroserpens sp.]MBO6605443.1 rhodanese-related sulfurtransferase [Psychroserpens sp.]MBO6630081.1 rhodanese-related sulfurtransferase [Psychroserpens sp.]MBO6653748.1 rhodanese-related sulfurtransferase [Psychroserpens sp.]MBO6682069.1 rhodanese-related sulfurtransferase [Psychroserpens sp.]MBO6748817.1 rhodanese-related sulfurtransferase [Psychroserpens sp.]
MQLYNNLSAKERAELIEKAGKERLTISFYKYAKIGNTQIFRNHMFIAWDELDVLGRIYIATEGINAQLSVPAENFNGFKSHLDTISFLENARLNIAIEHDNYAFLKLKVKVRHKIVADGLNDDSFDVTNKGVHVGAERFNDLIEDPNTVLVDMRNHYESEIGHFKNAITPDVDTFRESLDLIEEDLKEHKEDKNLVMYCTGGIRCEKASAYYKHKGFKKVFQLEGGIINYVRQVEAQNLENKFIGKNFVFDQRRSERISEDVIAQCHQCGKPADMHTNCANEACHLLFIQCDECKEQMENCCSSHCMEVNRLPYEEQKQLRKGQGNSNDIFKKGRADHLKYKKDLRNIFDNFEVGNK